MSGVGAQHVKWDEDFFEKVLAESWQCISAVTGHQNLLPWDIELVIDESVDEQEEEPDD
jgi:hypothetical protein